MLAKSLPLLVSILICLSSNVNSQNWVQKQNYTPSPRMHARPFMLGNVIYTTIGTNNTTHFDETWKYNTSSDSWTQVADFPDSLGRSGGVAMAYGNKGIAGLGWRGYQPSMKDLQVYDPNLNQWTLLTNYPGGGGRIHSLL